MSAGQYLDDAVERVPFGDHVGKSGAALERVTLKDGRRLVVKRMSPTSDLVMALSGGTVGREYLLWTDGVLDALPPAVGHAVVDGWCEGDVTVIVMRDLGDAVLTWDDRLSHGQARQVFGALAQMYTGFMARPLDGLTPLPSLLGLFAIDRLTPYADNANPLAAIALRGWDIFAETVADDVAEPVLALLADTTPLATALLARPATLIHGDLATVNMALDGQRLTLIDWTMPAYAPPAVDLARLIAGCSSVIDATREQLIDDFRSALGPDHDGPALRLALLGGLVWLGWNKALDAVEHPDLAVRRREQDDLDWWVREARETLQAGLL